ncbi:MAG: hypothetical protein HQ469_12630 [Cyanobacteria bacterium]|nr:hypothetical protein [Cyanobacteria bacterium bin.275]
MASTSPPGSMELLNHTSTTATDAAGAAIGSPGLLDAERLRQVLRQPAGAAGWLLQHRQGQLHRQLSEALAAVLLACRDTEKPGEITLKIRVRPNPDYLGQMLISDQVLAKPPEQATSTAYLFDADALRLHGEEEGQLSIPLAS